MSTTTVKAGPPPAGMPTAPPLPDDLEQLLRRLRMPHTRAADPEFSYYEDLLVLFKLLRESFVECISHGERLVRRLRCISSDRRQRQRCDFAEGWAD